MDYNEILSEIKILFIEKLEKIVNDEAYKANLLLSKQSYLDTLYSDIMALGYNFGDIKKATEDIYEMQSALFGDSKELHKNIQLRVEETNRLYPALVNSFSKFHKETQEGEDFEKVLDEIKLDLLKA